MGVGSNFQEGRMASARLIRRSINNNSRLEAMPLDLVDFFKRLIVETDIEGRLWGNSKQLRENLYGRRPSVTSRRIEGWLNTLWKSKDTDTGLGLIERYDAEGQACIWLPGHAKHQPGLRIGPGRAAPSEIPEPPAKLLALARKNLVAAKGAESGRPKAEVKTYDVKVAGMVAYYEKATGRTLGTADLLRMIEFADEYEDGWFEKAVDEVVASPEPINSPVPYIAKCLENWKVAGGPTAKREKRAPASSEDGLSGVDFVN